MCLENQRQQVQMQSGHLQYILDSKPHFSAMGERLDRGVGIEAPSNGRRPGAGGARWRGRRQIGRGA